MTYISLSGGYKPAGNVTQDVSNDPVTPKITPDQAALGEVLHLAEKFLKGGKNALRAEYVLAPEQRRAMLSKLNSALAGNDVAPVVLPTPGLRV